MEILKTNKETADLFQEYLDELAFGMNPYDEETENDEWRDYEDNRERIEYVRSDIAPDITIFLTKWATYVLPDFHKKYPSCKIQEVKWVAGNESEDYESQHFWTGSFC